MIWLAIAAIIIICWCEIVGFFGYWAKPTTPETIVRALGYIIAIIGLTLLYYGMKP